MKLALLITLTLMPVMAGSAAEQYRPDAWPPPYGETSPDRIALAVLFPEVFNEDASSAVVDGGNVTLTAAFDRKALAYYQDSAVVICTLECHRADYETRRGYVHDRHITLPIEGDGWYVKQYRYPAEGVMELRYPETGLLAFQ